MQMQKYGFISKTIMQKSEPTDKKHYINDFEEHNFTVLCYPPTFTMLPTIIFDQNTAGAHKEPSKIYN